MHFVPFLIHTKPHSHIAYACSLATTWRRGCIPPRELRHLEFAKRLAKFLLESAEEDSILAEFFASFQPEGVGAQMRRVYSATIGLLSESHVIVPHHLKVPQTTISSCT